MSAPYVPHTETEIAEMLDFLGLAGLDELFSEIPAALRLTGGLHLAPEMSEADVAVRLDELAAANRPAGNDLVCFAGAGAYDHQVPAVVRSLASRSEFLTAYTPYQPELSQGVLQAIFEYQTLVARLSGLEVANASLYDGAASLVEAVNMAVVATGNTAVACSQGVNPHWREQLETFSRGPGNEILVVPLSQGTTAWDKVADHSSLGAVVVAVPNFLGCLEDIGAARELADRTGARLVVCFDPVSAGLLRSPGELGADIVVGEGQPFGAGLAFGGPYLGLFACRLREVRRLPGRIVGETLDSEGRRAYVMTLRAREQDIRRERASSNVCTNQTLMAVTAAIYLSWLGPQGLREMALRCARATRYMREALCRIDGVEPLCAAPILREFALSTRVAPEVLIERLMEDGFLAGVPIRQGFEATPYEGGLLLAATEKHTRREIDAFASAFQGALS
jgi:glycine dehydrogenase subunit 1